MPRSGKKSENKKEFQVREKSGNFNYIQGNLEKIQGKVRELKKNPKKYFSISKSY